MVIQTHSDDIESSSTTLVVSNAEPGLGPAFTGEL